MSNTATLSRLFAGIEPDMEAVDRLFRERATSGIALLNDASLHILGSQGKKLRTGLTLLTGKLVDYRPEKLVPLSAGFEMLHLASLVHDDIIDRAATRRNLATVNARFGNDLAILLGDYYFAKTAGLIADVNDNRIDRLFSDTVATLVEGAIMEMLDAHHLDLSYERYLERISAKTAFLIGSCCKGSALVCGATDAQVEELRQFGHNLGMAFQIVDDILDYTGTEASIGKPAGNDLRQGMVTLPLIYSLQSNGSGHLELVRAIVEEPGKHNDEVDKLVAWVNAGPGIDAALADAKRYAARASDILNAFPSVHERLVLDDIIDYVIVRER
ncbi:MAG: polyprenyl synthetase family protein [Ktedonobacterales bacterium]|nr:polyprenyl synthetase family protein [Ktedonobacterales bacterium]